MNREVKDLIREITKRGWAVVQGRTHFKARRPGCGMVTISVSPSNPSGVRNARADILRAERALTAKPVSPVEKPVQHGAGRTNHKR